MNRVWFREQLETVATFWRVLRRDGIAIGLTSHDQDLWIDGILHRAAPGMVPSSIRRSADFEPDSAEVQGALTHASFTAADLESGRFDGAQVRIGLVDWETGESQILYRGAIGAVSQESGRFTAELVSRKADLLVDPIPRTSPTCRAEFCGPGCNLDPQRHTFEASVTLVDLDRNAIGIASSALTAALLGGSLRWVDGPHVGQTMTVLSLYSSLLVLDAPLSPDLAVGQKARVRDGCFHTLAHCVSSFANGANFQGEPYLPGNDHITRYPTPAA